MAHLKTRKTVLIAGSSLTGLICARELATKGFRVEIFTEGPFHGGDWLDLSLSSLVDTASFPHEIAFFSSLELQSLFPRDTISPVTGLKIWNCEQQKFTDFLGADQQMAASEDSDFLLYWQRYLQIQTLEEIEKKLASSVYGFFIAPPRSLSDTLEQNIFKQCPQVHFHKNSSVASHNSHSLTLSSGQRFAGETILTTYQAAHIEPEKFSQQWPVFTHFIWVPKETAEPLGQHLCYIPPHDRFKIRQGINLSAFHPESKNSSLHLLAVTLLRQNSPMSSLKKELAYFLKIDEFSSQYQKIQWQSSRLSCRTPTLEQPPILHPPSLPHGLRDFEGTLESVNFPTKRCPQESIRLAEIASEYLRRLMKNP